MKPLLIPAIVITIIVVNIANSKNNVPSFKEIEYALYRVNTSDATIKDKVSLDMYLTMAADGSVKSTIVNYNLKCLEYYTYQLNSNDLKKFIDFFDGKQELKTFLVKQKYEPGTTYAGQYEYLSVKYTSGGADSISYVTDFMATKFDDVVDLFTNDYYHDKKIEAKIKVPIPSQLLNTLLASYKQSKYLPAIEYILYQRP